MRFSSSLNLKFTPKSWWNGSRCYASANLPRNALSNETKKHLRVVCLDMNYRFVVSIRYSTQASASPLHRTILPAVPCLARAGAHRRSLSASPCDSIAQVRSHARRGLPRQEVLPEVDIVVDRFHVMQNLNTALSAVLSVKDGNLPRRSPTHSTTSRIPCQHTE